MIPLRNQGYTTLPPERHLPHQENNLALQNIQGLKKGGKVTKKGKKGTTATANATVHVHMAKRSYARRAPSVTQAKPMNGFPMNIQITPPPNVSQGIPTGVAERELPQQFQNIHQNIDLLRKEFMLSHLLLQQAHSHILSPTDGSRNLYPTNVPPPPQAVNHQIMGDMVHDAVIAGSRRINPSAYPFPSASGASNSLEEMQIQQGTQALPAQPASSGDLPPKLIPGTQNFRRAESMRAYHQRAKEALSAQQRRLQSPSIGIHNEVSSSMAVPSAMPFATASASTSSRRVGDEYDMDAYTPYTQVTMPLTPLVYPLAPPASGSVTSRGKAVKVGLLPPLADHPLFSEEKYVPDK